MWRWYVEVAFLAVLCFGIGAAVAALVLARVLPPASPSSSDPASADGDREGAGGAS